MAATFSKGRPIPELVFVVFQATFAAITCCLMLGAFAERAKFSAVLVFITLWFTFSYAPIAHMVWFWMGPDAYTDPKVVDAMTAKAGLIWQWGALDFAGGTVVHINSGVAGLVGAYVMGKRIGYGKEAMAPHNVTLTMIGAALLWTGWFGFNAVPRSRPALGRAGVHQHLPGDRLRGAVLALLRDSSRASPRCWVPPRAPSRASLRSRPPRQRRLPGAFAIGLGAGLCACGASTA